MATAVISGRVDLAIKEKADAFIHAAGLNPAEIIKVVWEDIAKTGQIPVPSSSVSDDESDPIESFTSFCDALPPAPRWLNELTDEQMHEMLGERDE